MPYTEMFMAAECKLKDFQTLFKKMIPPPSYGVKIILPICIINNNYLRDKFDNLIKKIFIKMLK